MARERTSSAAMEEAPDHSDATTDPLEASDPAIMIVESMPARDDVSARTKVHAGAPRPVTASPMARGPTAAQALATVRSPSHPMVAEELDEAVEIDLAETTDFSAPLAQATAETSETTDTAALHPVSPADAAAPTEVTQAGPPPQPSSDGGEPRPRKTAIGIAVGRSDVAVEPDETTDRSVVASDETTGPDPITVGDGDGEADASAPAALLHVPASLEEETPLEIWRLPPGAVVPVHAAGAPGATSPDASPPDPTPASAAGAEGAALPTSSAPRDPVAAAMPGAVLPNGDWTIALDPGAPDGWSAPFPIITTADPAGDPSDAPARARPANALRPRAPLSRDELPAAEPKVQIDPTLIEPLRPMPLDPRFSADASRPPGPPGANATPYGLPPSHGNEAPAYAMDPGYQMIPVENVSLPGGSFGDLRHGSETALRIPPSRRRAIIVITSAAVAVAIGIVLVAVLTRQADPDALRDTPKRAPSRVAPPAAPMTKPANPEQPSAAGQAATPGEPATATGAAAGTGPCFANVSSTPTGAEIVIDQTKVIGTTPQTVSLPCGAEVELLVRKARLLPVTRTVTPTPTGVKVRVALTKQVVQIKVSSNPEGATITLNGKSLGVTPTTIKVPAFESSTLIITKTGYETEAEKVSPKSTGAAVRIQLHRLDRASR